MGHITYITRVKSKIIIIIFTSSRLSFIVNNTHNIDITRYYKQRGNTYYNNIII